MKKWSYMRLSFTGIMAVVCAMGLSARAQDGVEDVTPDATPVPEEWVFKPTVGAQFHADTDVDNGSSFSVSSLKAGIGTGRKINEDLGWDVKVSYTRSAYDFSDTASFGGTPWEDIDQINGRVLFKYRYDEQWVLLGGPIVKSAMEDNADEDAVTAGGVVGAVYAVDADLSLGLAVAAISQIEDDATILPIPLIQWKIDDEWSLKTGAWDVAAGNGVGAEIAYLYAEDLTFALGALGQKQRFRLDDSGPAPNGVGEDKSGLLYAQASWQYSEGVNLQLVAGINGGGELKLDNKNGDEVAKEDYDPSGMLGARAAFQF